MLRAGIGPDRPGFSLDQHLHCNGDLFLLPDWVEGDLFQPAPDAQPPALLQQASEMMEAMLTGDVMKTRHMLLYAAQLLSTNFRAHGAVKYLKAT